MQAHVQFFIDNPDFYRVMMLELPDHRLKLGGDIMRRHERYIQPLVNVIKSAMKAGQVKRIDAELAAFILASMSCTVVERYLRGKKDTRRGDIALAIDLFLNGVSK
jgi:hypothetical protein